MEPDSLVGKVRELISNDGVVGLLNDSCTIMWNRVEEETTAVVESLGLR